MNNLIAASILSADLANLADSISACEQAGVDWIHVDAMDGHFVPNLTMGAIIVKACRQSTSLPIDCHLMVEKPEALVGDFAKAGATTITIHPENNPNIHRTLSLIKDHRCLSGVALNPGTSCAVIKPLLPFIDMVLVMTVNPGFGGQSFIETMLPKIKEAKKLVKGNDIEILVDGGVTEKNIKKIREAGADILVAGSAVFNKKDSIKNNIIRLKALV